MNDQFRSVTNVGIGSRLAESIKGVLVGILFFLGSFPLLFWNVFTLLASRLHNQTGNSETVSRGHQQCGASPP